MQSAGVVNLLPWGNSDVALSFNIAGQPPFPPGSEAAAKLHVVSPGYFEALKISIAAGPIDRGRRQRESSQVVLVSEEFVRTYFPGQNPLGQQLIN